jgi:hypothetical protein
MNDGQNFALVVMMLLISYNGRIDDGQVWQLVDYSFAIPRAKLARIRELRTD